MTKSMITIAATLAIWPCGAWAGGHLEFGYWVVTSDAREHQFTVCSDAVSSEMAKDPNNWEAGDCVAYHITTGKPMPTKCEAALKEFGNALELKIKACVAKWESGRKSR